MATSASFTMDLAEIIEEAFERASGGSRELRSGYDYRTARRSLNLLTMEWANRGLNLWTVEEGSISLTQGVGEYTLPADTVDLMEYYTRQNEGTSSQVDLAMSRVSVSTHAALPNKLIQGRPTQLYIQRSTVAPVIHVWPLPDNDAYKLIYWRLRRIQDAGSTGADTMDVPFRFVPALIAGLAFHIAQKIPQGESRAQLLNAAYEQAFSLAADEDREKATVRFVPRIRR